MKNKGFTLIELLAVVTIFSIICLLAIPPILNQVNNNKSVVSKANLEIIYKAVNLYMSDVEPNSTYCISLQDLVDKDLLATPIQDFETGANLSPDRKIKIMTDANKKLSPSLLGDGVACSPIVAPPQQVYASGDVINYNPETNTKCTVDEVNWEPAAKTGCLKWNVITTTDSSNKATVDLMLDHNTTSNVAWNSIGNNSGGMKEALTALNSDVGKWSLEAKNSARLISGEEVMKVVDNTTWTTGGTPASVSSKYWLYQNLSSENTVASPIGYWTSTINPPNSSIVWSVQQDGYLSFGYVTIGNRYGIRPVVTVSKSVLL